MPGRRAPVDSGALEHTTMGEVAAPLEAATGFEPVIRALQARALPLGYAASGIRG